MRMAGGKVEAVLPRVHVGQRTEHGYLGPRLDQRSNSVPAGVGMRHRHGGQHLGVDGAAQCQ